MVSQLLISKYRKPLTRAVALLARSPQISEADLFRRIGYQPSLESADFTATLTMLAGSPVLVEEIKKQLLLADEASRSIAAEAIAFINLSMQQLGNTVDQNAHLILELPQIAHLSEGDEGKIDTLYIAITMIDLYHASPIARLLAKGSIPTAAALFDTIEADLIIKREQLILNRANLEKRQGENILTAHLGTQGLIDYIQMLNTWLAFMEIAQKEGSIYAA